jgi:hypothetical protein
MTGTSEGALALLDVLQYINNFQSLKTEEILLVNVENSHD